MGNGSKRTIELERLDYSLEDAIIRMQLRKEYGGIW